MSLRSNQINAVKISNDNNFKSGVHFHATGTGKSWISLEIILNFNKNTIIEILFGCANKNLF